MFKLNILLIYYATHWNTKYGFITALGKGIHCFRIRLFWVESDLDSWIVDFQANRRRIRESNMKPFIRESKLKAKPDEPVCLDVRILAISRIQTKRRFDSIGRLFLANSGRIGSPGFVFPPFPGSENPVNCGKVQLTLWCILKEYETSHQYLSLKEYEPSHQH